jgi:hypothetical protein
MEDLGLTILKISLFVFAVLGIIFHLLALRNPEKAKKVEQRLGTEYGVRKKFFPWLEENRMEFHERLIRSKFYNLFATIFLIALLILLVQI